MSAEDRSDLRMLALIVVLAALLIAAIIWTAPAVRARPLPQCVPAIVTLHSYTRGQVELDGCMLSTHYGGAVAGLTVEMVSPDNLSGDGIFRSGFEVLPQ